MEAAYRLTQALVEELASTNSSDLKERLRGVAELVVSFSGLSGAMVIALDEEGLPLTAGTHGAVPLPREGSELAGLFQIYERLREKSRTRAWIQLDAPQFKTSGHLHHLALPILGGKDNDTLGILLVSFPGSEPIANVILQAVELSSAALAVAIQSAIRAQAWSRIEALQDLAHVTFDSRDERSWDLQALIEHLAKYFKSDVVTLFLTDQEELRLAASTDSHLGKKPYGPVVYQRGQGLTGYVFETGRAIRLSDTSDREEIRLATGMDREGPLHPERDKEGRSTYQFMGVPLRFGGKVVGVLRMSRREGIARFTREDQKALQFFADLLGAVLAPSAQYRRFLDVFETLGIAYFREDMSGMTLESTRLDSVLTGYSPEELGTLPRHMLYLDPAHRQRLFKRARNNQGKIAREVVPMRRKDGTLFFAEADLRIIEETGKEIGYEGFYRDVTDRIRLQRFLNEDTERVLSEDELFTLLKQESEFHLDYLSSLGHQLQTPLSSLIQTLRNLEQGMASPRGIADRLPYAIGQAIVCSRLVRNLSFMDQILRGDRFQHQDVPITKLAIQTKLDFIHLLREKRLELIIDDESLKRILRVEGHQEMLRQMMVNLVDNAIKYSLPGTSIQIRARHLPDGPSLEISNVGLPVPEEEREKIFQRGYRTRKAHALVPHGTGLGLWLVRKIVEAHGASIRFHELDEGGPKRNLFRICFPQPASTRRTL